MPDAIRIDGVGKEYQLSRRARVQVLEDVSLRVERGAFVALLGPSGSGKSTILRLVAALEQPTTGRVTIEGESPEILSRRHRLGVAFQDHALLPWLSIAGNVALPYRIARRPVDRARVGSLLQLVGIAGFAKARPSQLSGGMRQRASIARALVLQPEVLLLDEPFGALDAVTRREMNIEVQRIWSAQAITTLLVTHAVEEAVFLADRVVVLSARPGRVRAEIAIPFARPRLPSLTRTLEFHTLCDRLTALLEPGA